MINLSQHERRITSQNGEDGVIQKIFENIPIKNKQFIEIGADPHQANCLNLWRNEWKGVFFDGRDHSSHPMINPSFYQKFLTRENINSVMDECLPSMSKDLDVLSIDTDGIEFYLWNNLDESWTPSLVIVEMNPQLGFTDDKVMVYDANFVWRHTSYYGTSAVAWMNLARKKGYSLVHIEKTCTNMFFVKTEYLGSKMFVGQNDLSAFSHLFEAHKNRFILEDGPYIKSTDIL